MWKHRSCHTGGYALNIDYSDREGNFLPRKVLVSHKRLVLQKITELRIKVIIKNERQGLCVHGGNIISMGDSILMF